jgi:signal peptidase I
MRRTRTRKSGKSEGGGRTLRLILYVAVLAWLVKSLVFAPFSIPSGSMLPTLFVGDYVVASKWPYGFSRYSFPFGLPPFEGRILSNLPERGDVVIFAAPGGEGSDLIKRVIALPGDTIEVRGGRLLLNGRAVQRRNLRPAEVRISPNSPCRVVAGATAMVRDGENGGSCVYPAYQETLPNGVSYDVIDQVENPAADMFGPATVPAGHLFLMGDNRDDSLDSRFDRSQGGVGFVPVDHLVGRASTIFWSTDGSASYARPWTWFTALREDRIGKDFKRRQ